MTDPEHYRAQLELDRQAEEEERYHQMEERYYQMIEALLSVKGLDLEFDREDLWDAVIEEHERSPEGLPRLLSDIAAAKTEEAKIDAFEAIQMWLNNMIEAKAEKELC